MRISKLTIRNYRTLEEVDLEFPSPYSAICGANDSGKTNVVRAIRGLMKEEPGPMSAFDEKQGLHTNEDYPKWKDTEPAKRSITVGMNLHFHKDRDAALYQFVVKQLSLESPGETLDLQVSVTSSADGDDPQVEVKTSGKTFSDINAQEVLNKLQSSRSVLFHNSAQATPRYYYPGGSIAGTIREIAGQHEPLVAAMKKTVDRGLSKISRKQQSELEDLLGRLQTKYRVGLSMPAFDFDYLPFSITLGERKYDVPLNSWGSGTKNRTMILLALFRARQIGESALSAQKRTPVIVIEEPESFLHPSAQAEFGRVLQDLAEEFGVQVIVTTHSPYLLSMKNSASNILLRRRVKRGQFVDTERVDTTGENWMAPFGQALGLDSEEFQPWKSLILTGSDAILLVEGETDKEYFEMLRDNVHGSQRLLCPGEIVAFEGTGSLENTVLLRFVKNRFRKLFVTFDLDAADRVEKKLHSLQLEKGTHYAPVGLNAPGKKCIEGLLPDKVTSAVHTANTDLVQAAMSGSKDEKESATNKLKKLFLEQFKKVAVPGSADFQHFYALTKVINKALAK
jgi:putative ATP-dependent endonuclease of the OLD family